MLQYADDTTICLKHNIGGAKNLKIMLYMYELMAGLKTNFYKSEVMTINDEENQAATFAGIFNYQVGIFILNILNCLLRLDFTLHIGCH